MPFASREDVRLYWKVEGESGKPVLLLLNSIGTDMGLWDRCVPHLLPAFRVLRMDTRGHGASDSPDGAYTMPMLADDVTAVMSAAGVDKALVAGCSLGGMIAMQLALDHPSRVEGLALVCTSATMDSQAWEDRIAAVRVKGMSGIVDLAMGRFLSPEFAEAHREVAESIRTGLLAMPPSGYAGAGSAIRDLTIEPRLGELSVPTLVVAGNRDISTPYEPHGRILGEKVPGAVVEHLTAAHLAPVEAPASLAAVLRRFFMAPPNVADAADTLYEVGLDNRRRVLGDAWVDRSLAKRTPFNADFQEMITRIAWQEVWGRPGLDDRTRRLLVIAITASLGRWEEFALHVRSGLQQEGFTRDELKEVLMQTAIYAGVPAANTGFAEAVKILAEMDGGQE